MHTNLPRVTCLRSALILFPILCMGWLCSCSKKSPGMQTAAVDSGVHTLGTAVRIDERNYVISEMRANGVSQLCIYRTDLYPPFGEVPELHGRDGGVSVVLNGKILHTATKGKGDIIVLDKEGGGY